MKAFSLRPSSTAAVTSRTGSPDASSAATPSGAATTQTAVTSVAPRAAIAVGLWWSTRTDEVPTLPSDDATEEGAGA